MHSLNSITPRHRIGRTLRRHLALLILLTETATALPNFSSPRGCPTQEQFNNDIASCAASQDAAYVRITRQAPGYLLETSNGTRVTARSCETLYQDALMELRLSCDQPPPRAKEPQVRPYSSEAASPSQGLRSTHSEGSVAQDTVRQPSIPIDADCRRRNSCSQIWLGVHGETAPGSVVNEAAIGMNVEGTLGDWRLRLGGSWYPERRTEVEALYLGTKTLRQQGTNLEISGCYRALAKDKSWLAGCLGSALVIRGVQLAEAKEESLDYGVWSAVGLSVPLGHRLFQDWSLQLEPGVYLAPWLPDVNFTPQTVVSRKALQARIALRVSWGLPLTTTSSKPQLTQLAAR